MRRAKTGDPMREDTELGPLARADLREALHKQITASIEQGARLLLGGKKPEGAGNFYPATVLARVVPGMPAFDEETLFRVGGVIESSANFTAKPTGY
jgi:succinate-semialdehyde dehydrogenase/glutarate-semialdehyde dehydrogenase